MRDNYEINQYSWKKIQKNDLGFSIVWKSSRIQLTAIFSKFRCFLFCSNLKHFESRLLQLKLLSQNRIKSPDVFSNNREIPLCLIKKTLWCTSNYRGLCSKKQKSKLFRTNRNRSSDFAFFSFSNKTQVFVSHFSNNNS